MSGNKYELAEVAFFPNLADSARGALLFKVLFSQTGQSTNLNDETRITDTKTFINGKHPAWEVDEATAKDEVEGALAAAANATVNDAAAAKRVVAAVKKARDLRDNGATATEKDLGARILQLYDLAFKFTFQPTAASGAAGSPAVTNPKAANRNDDGIKTVADANIVHTGTPTAGQLKVEVNTNRKANLGLNKNYGSIGGPDMTGSTTASGDDVIRRKWDWNVNKLTSRLLGSVTASSGADAYSALIGSVTGPKFDKTVERNSSGELVIVDKDGKEHPISTWSAKREACDNIAHIGNDRSNCYDLTKTCLAENKDGNPTALVTENCRDAIVAASKKPDVRTAVGNMDPRAAFRLLKNLGLKGKKVDGLVRCEPYDEWAQRVTDNKITKDDKSAVNLTTAGVPSATADIHNACKTFVKDEKVTDFIKLVIGFIDSNKAILNKGASRGASANYDVADPFGRKRPRGNDKNSDLSDARTVIEGSLHSMHSHILRLLGNMPIGITVPHAVQLMGHIGGGNQVGGSSPAYVVQPHSGRKMVVPRFSDRLTEIYEHYLARLKSMNKDLSEATKSKVQGVLENVKEKEDNLLKWVEYLQRYYEIAQSEGDMTSQEVGPEELKQAYEKYEKNLVKLRKRSINFIDILSTLSTATNDAEKGTSTNLPSSI